jgi:hypothetical protein
MGPDPTFTMTQDSFTNLHRGRSLVDDEFEADRARRKRPWTAEENAFLRQQALEDAKNDWLARQNAREYENQQKAMDWQRQQQAQQSAWGNESAQAQAARAHEARLAEGRQNALSEMWGQMMARRQGMQGGGGGQQYYGGGQQQQYPQQSNNLLSLYNQSGEHF